MSSSETSMEKGFIIVIDGPVASGKGTIARRMANEFDGFHMDTGAMYRSVTLYCLNNHIPVDVPEQVIEALGNINVRLDNDIVEMNGENVTSQIRESQVSL